VQGIAEIITVPGVINADFADVKAVMANAGSALMGIGQANGENKAIEAAKAAINSNLLDMSIDGARGIVFTITGGPDLSMNEVSDAAKVITSAADEDAKIIFGAVIDEKMKDQIKITVVATGFDGKSKNNTKTEIKSYTPNPFIESEKEKEESNISPWGDKKSKTPAIKNIPLKPLVDKKNEKSLDQDLNLDEEDDLSVPAFIRKKMGG
jgi:cell division protein FtsZ